MAWPSLQRQRDDKKTKLKISMVGPTISFNIKEFEGGGPRLIPEMQTRKPCLELVRHLFCHKLSTFSLSCM